MMQLQQRFGGEQSSSFSCLFKSVTSAIILHLIYTVCIELRIGRFLEAERTTQDGGPFNTGKVGVSLYPI